MGVFKKTVPYILLVASMALTGCTLAPGVASTPTLTQGVAVSPVETETPVPQPTATQAPSPTLPPPSASPTPTVEPPAHTPAPVEESGEVPTLLPPLTPVPPDTPPVAGTFDVYLGAPLDNQEQPLSWIDIATGGQVTEIRVQIEDGKIRRAGSYIYYVAPRFSPVRVNTAGAQTPVTFAIPPDDTDFYEFLPSATGNWLAWMYGNSADLGQYNIALAFKDGSDAEVRFSGEAEPGSTFRLVRVTNDGTEIFFDVRPPELENTSDFQGYYNIHVLDVSSGEVTQVSGEPACIDQICSGHVSPDGAFLARTMQPGQAPAPVIVTNLVSGAVIARFSALGAPSNNAFELGYPFFTPGGELVYVEAIQTLGTVNYQLVYANLVTGEQQIVTPFGETLHRPLGWTGDGYTLLTTTEPGNFDTWQIDIKTGARKKIAALLFLGTIIETAE